MSPTEKKYIHKKEQPQAAGVKGGCNVRMHSQRGHHCRYVVSHPLGSSEEPREIILKSVAAKYRGGCTYPAASPSH